MYQQNNTSMEKWGYKGVLKLHHVASSGYRYYSQEQLTLFFGLLYKEKKLEKRLRRLQRSVSRKYQMNKGGKPFLSKRATL